MGFFVLLMLALMIVNPKAKKEDVKLKSNIMVEVEWGAELSSDVDLFMQMPNNNIVSYYKRDVPGAQLSRDDTGVKSDKVVMPDGSISIIKENWEHGFITKPTPGWYTINVILYENRDERPIPVKVKIQQFKPYKIIYNGVVTLRKNKEEKTVIRFRLDGSGKVIDRNDNFKSLKMRLVR
jgi:hypothetical protein